MCYMPKEQCVTCTRNAIVGSIPTLASLFCHHFKRSNLQRTTPETLLKTRLKLLKLSQKVSQFSPRFETFIFRQLGGC